jgi:hypothetical protein
LSLSPDGLVALVRPGDTSGVIRAFTALSEEERRALAPTALELRKRHDTFRGSEPLGHATDEASRIAVYGTASLGELHRLSRLLAAPPRQVAAVLRLRPASILESLAPWFLEHYGRWDAIRGLVRDGLMATPSSPWYTLSMIARHGASPAELLRSDPFLLDDEVWRLFEIEGSGESSLAAHDKYVPDEGTWQFALVEVASSDQARRERLLDASLAALGRDMAAFRAGWFSRFHEALTPTLDEREARGEAYARLLRSPIRTTVGFAVAALDVLARASRLPRDGVIERLGVALTGEAAGTARSALRILERVGTTDPSRGPDVARAVAADLGSAVPEVQSAALHLVERFGEPGDPLLADALGSQASSIHASQRETYERVLAHVAGALEQPPDIGPVTQSPARVSARPIDPLDPSRALAPIRDLDELVDVLTAVLETGGPADDIERALDGVSRLGRPGPDFERRTGPLERRARTLLGRRWENADPRIDLACLVVRWARRVVHEPRPYAGPAAFLAARVKRVGDKAAHGLTAPLLAAPTHAGGWIDPTTLVERLAAWPDGSDPDELDAVAALLRLGPGGRERALGAMEGALGAANGATIGGLRGEVADALRHALGGSVKVGPAAALWVAAARTRRPDADDPEVESRHRGLGPDAGRAARIEVVHGHFRHDLDRIMYPLGLGIALDPPMPKKPRLDLPTVLLLADGGWQAFEPGRGVEQLRWEATIWPAWRESWCAIGAIVLGRNIDWWSAQWANRAYVEPLLDPWVRIGPMAAVLLGVALGAKDAAERGLAADVVIAAVEEGRIDESVLAGGLARVAELGVARPRRWATALADVAAVSSRHARIAQEASARAMGSLAGGSPGDTVPLLRLVLELVHETGEPLSPEGTVGIATVGGGGLGRGLARSILSASDAAGQARAVR